MTTSFIEWLASQGGRELDIATDGAGEPFLISDEGTDNG